MYTVFEILDVMAMILREVEADIAEAELNGFVGANCAFEGRGWRCCELFEVNVLEDVFRLQSSVPRVKPVCVFRTKISICARSPLCVCR